MPLNYVKKYLIKIGYRHSVYRNNIFRFFIVYLRFDKELTSIIVAWTRVDLISLILLLKLVSNDNGGERSADFACVDEISSAF